MPGGGEVDDRDEQLLAAMAMATGHSPPDLLATPPPVFDKMIELVVAQQREQAREQLRARLRARR